MNVRHQTLCSRAKRDTPLIVGPIAIGMMIVPKVSGNAVVKNVVSFHVRVLGWFVNVIVRM
jgi:hypothetical protein